jgi:transcriptional regulator with XRE-family HTH domain
MNTDIKIKLAKRLRKLREENNMTQEQLAEASGVDYKHIQLMESKDPSAAKIDTLEKIAKAFKLSVSSLLKFK